MEDEYIPMKPLNVEENDPLNEDFDDDESVYSEKGKQSVWDIFRIQSHATSRRFNLGEKPSGFAANLVQNQKYSVLTFLPRVIYEQFKYFFNLYFLLIALSQLIPSLQVGTLLSPNGQDTLLVTLDPSALFYQ